MSTRILIGDCRAVLPTLEAGSVQCCVTSPPYFGLRDYGTASWDGGDAACDHTSRATKVSSASTLRTDGRAHVGPYAGEKATIVAMPYLLTCGKCGASRTDRQIGLEPTPDAYVAEMVAVFREVRRVLRDDGVVWLNLGDSYNAYNGGAGHSSALSQTASKQRPKLETGFGLRTKSLKPKDLLMIPARVALALQADGWFLRSDVIWAKPNPMPESVTDRPTSAHEHVFLLTKQTRYFYDADAIRQPLAAASYARLAEDIDAQPGSQRANGGTRAARPMKAVRFGGNKGQGDHGSAARRASGNGWDPKADTANARNVWTIATQPYSGAHFATMPPELAERCIKAGSKPGDTILDPFSGAGTTALVADRLGRHGIGIELNPGYSALASNRVSDDSPLFAEVSCA